uniref:Gustatory receptor n=1 Tax=Panagrolaimus sp. ES5 TaxID=591445 RepID=A0AC34FXT1_9BILA
MSCDKYMDIQFTEGYKNFTQIIGNFMKEQKIYAISNYENKSPILLYLFLSTMFSALASMTLFPSLRYSTMYIRASLEASKPMQLLLHITFLLPVFILTLFMNPVRRHFVDGRYDFITQSRYEAARIFLIVIWALLRLFTAKIHFQSFLDSPNRKLQQLQKETGYIKSNDLQKLIIQYAQYFCAAALQYFLPVFLTLVVSLILKNLGDIDFFGTFNPSSTTSEIPKEMPAEIIDSNSLASLRVLLNFSAQKAFWSYCLVNLLIINVALTAFGTVYSYNFVAEN